MKKLLLALALLLAPSLASAQCNGVFPANTLCGNLTASPKTPSPISANGTVVGPGSSTVNDLAVWNNTTGTLLKDVPFLSLQVSGGTSLGFFYNNAGTVANSSFIKQTTNIAGTPTIFVGTGSDTDDSGVLVSRLITPAGGLLNTHAFRDSTIANQTVTASGFSGYSSFDSAINIGGIAFTPMNHIRGFQSRVSYSTNGTVNELAGLWIGNGAAGAGVNVATAYGVQVTNLGLSSGATAVNQYAYHADTLSGATNNYQLFLGNNPSVLNGQLFVGGKTTAFSGEQMNLQFVGPGASGFTINNTDSGAGTESSMSFLRNSSNVGSVVTSLTTTTYNTTSDERLKNFTGRYDPAQAIRVIRADPVRKFNWKATGESAIGWGAQTSYAVSHDLATKPVNPDDNWGVPLAQRTPYLWAAVTQLLDRVDSLERQLKTAKRRSH